MKDAAYWKRRAEILNEAAHKKADRSIADIEKAYREAEIRTKKEIEAWYGRLAENNQISLSDARKLLNKNELAEFKWTVERYIQEARKANLSPEWQKKLENASAKFHISRLESVQMGIQQQIELLYGSQHEAVDSLLREIISDGYYGTAYNVQRGLGIGWDIAKLNQNKLDKLLLKPWTTDGRTFSERIWANKASLSGGIQNELVQGVLRGDSPRKITDRVAKRFGVSRYQAGRLVHTETAYFSAAADKESYKELDVEEVEIVETLDYHTCEICGSMDGKKVPLNQMEPGVTVPPFHPNCVLPDTMIASPDGEAIMKSSYSGEIVEITTANGRGLSITPNHIMLTSRGWVRAKNLIQGDQVIYYCGWDKFIVEADPTQNDGIPTVEQIFASFLKSCPVPPVSVPTTAKDFKGDAIENGKVDVIFINGLLRNEVNPSVLKFFSDFPLIRASESGEAFLSGNCSLAQFLMGVGFASDGIMSGLNIAGVLLTGSLTHHELVCLRRGPHYNARLQQTALDDSLGDGEISGDFVDTISRVVQSDDFAYREFLSGVRLSDSNSCFIQDTSDRFAGTAKDVSEFCNAFPGAVEFDNITRIDRRFFSGHVYDLSSLSTLYLCNGFLSSNCRGTTAPVIDEELWGVGERAARDENGKYYTVPGDMTYEEWKEKFVDGKEKALTNASGQRIIEVSRTTITGQPNSITQKENKKGGIDRNYYGPDGKQVKQVSNNDHGHKKESSFGKHGEHAHDYYFVDGTVRHGSPRELTEEERKENSDIL